MTIISRVTRRASRALHNLPLKRLGYTRFIPVFFACGALIEFLMIKWTFKGTNFCKLKSMSLNLRCNKQLSAFFFSDSVFKRRQSREIAQAQIIEEYAAKGLSVNFSGVK